MKWASRMEQNNKREREGYFIDLVQHQCRRDHSESYSDFMPSCIQSRHYCLEIRGSNILYERTALVRPRQCLYTDGYIPLGKQVPIPQAQEQMQINYEARTVSAPRAVVLDRAIIKPAIAPCLPDLKQELVAIPLVGPSPFSHHSFR